MKWTNRSRYLTRAVFKLKDVSPLHHSVLNLHIFCVCIMAARCTWRVAATNNTTHPAVAERNCEILVLHTVQAFCHLLYGEVFAHQCSARPFNVPEFEPHPLIFLCMHALLSTNVSALWYRDKNWSHSAYFNYLCWSHFIDSGFQPCFGLFWFPWSHAHMYRLQSYCLLLLSNPTALILWLTVLKYETGSSCVCSGSAHGCCFSKW
jgi:hypothetical protein